MSTSCSHIRCHGCDFKGVIHHSPTILQYHLPNGQIVEGYRRSAWCSSCGDVTEAEKSLEPATIQAEIDSINSSHLGFFTRILKKVLGGGDAWREERDKLTAKLLLAQMRRSPPRCLRCGNAPVHTLAFDENGISDIVHSCGRRLYGVPEDRDATRLFYKPVVIALDPEGHRLCPS